MLAAKPFFQVRTYGARLSQKLLELFACFIANSLSRRGFECAFLDFFLFVVALCWKNKKTNPRRRTLTRCLNRADARWVFLNFQTYCPANCQKNVKILGRAFGVNPDIGMINWQIKRLAKNAQKPKKKQASRFFWNSWACFWMGAADQKDIDSKIAGHAFDSIFQKNDVRIRYLACWGAEGPQIPQ